MEQLITTLDQLETSIYVLKHSYQFKKDVPREHNFVIGREKKKKGAMLGENIP